MMDKVKKKIDEIIYAVLRKEEPIIFKELDSIDFVDIMLEIEREFKIKFKDPEFNELRDLSQLNELVKKKL